MNNLIKNYNYENEYRGNNSTPQKNKIDIKKMKKNTIRSLNDVECFLGNLNNFIKYIKLYKILR